MEADRTGGQVLPRRTVTNEFIEGEERMASATQE
jgi:hypothetical protein